MTDDHVSVHGEMHVAFECIGAGGERPLERDERVLGRMRAVASMGDDGVGGAVEQDHGVKKTAGTAVRKPKGRPG